MPSPKGSESPSNSPESPQRENVPKQKETSPEGAVRRCEPSKVCECGEPGTMMDFDLDDVWYCDFCGSFEGMLDAMRREGET
jgi:hypothetical protein